MAVMWNDHPDASFALWLASMASLVLGGVSGAIGMDWLASGYFVAAFVCWIASLAAI